ncbi:hypothetical protein L195_g060069, partial [Trifolium pratense]
MLPSIQMRWCREMYTTQLSCIQPMAFVGRGKTLKSPCLRMLTQQLLDGSTSMNMMIKSPAWDRITAYAAENRIKMALEAINLQEKMAVEANVDSGNELALEASDSNNGEKQRLYCIYDDEPLGFEKDPHSSTQRMQAQDPLQEIDIGDGSIK